MRLHFIEWRILSFDSNFTEMYSWGSNRSVLQIPQCTSPISHNAPFCNRNVHVCTFLLQNDALWDICLMHCHIIIINYFTALSSQFVGKCQPFNPWKLWLLLKKQKYNSICVQLDLKQKLSKWAMKLISDVLLIMWHYDDVIISAIASQITGITIVYSTVYPGADQSKHQSSASLAFVWGIHRGPVNSPHKWPVTRKMFLYDDFIMI